MSVREAADHWLHVCEHIGRKGREPVAKSTLRRYRDHARYIKASTIDDGGEEISFGAILLSKLTKDHIEGFRNKLIQTMSWKYSKKHMTSLKGLLDQARCDGYIEHKPAEFVFIRAPAREAQFDIEHDHKIPTIAEIQVLLATMRQRLQVSGRPLRRSRRRYKLIFETMAFGGTRPGEALGLPWSEVYFDKGGIRIIQDVEDDGTIGKPKSKAAYRFIPMPDHYMRQLRWWKKLCPKSKEDLVFPNWSGKIEFLSNVNRRGWQPLLKEAGLVDENGKHKYPPKSLRHARASLEIESGANPKEIQKLIGHSSIKVTYDIYGHLFDAHNGRRANRANNIADTLLNRNQPENVTHM